MEKEQKEKRELEGTNRKGINEISDRTEQHNRIINKYLREATERKARATGGHDCINNGDITGITGKGREFRKMTEIQNKFINIAQKFEEKCIQAADLLLMRQLSNELRAFVALEQNFVVPEQRLKQIAVGFEKKLLQFYDFQFTQNISKKLLLLDMPLLNNLNNMAINIGHNILQASELLILNNIVETQQELHLPSLKILQISALTLENICLQASELIMIQGVASNLQTLKLPILDKLRYIVTRFENKLPQAHELSILNGIINAQQNLHLPSLETLQNTALTLENICLQANEVIMIQSIASNLQTLKLPKLDKLKDIMARFENKLPQSHELSILNGIIDAQQKLYLPSLKIFQISALKYESMCTQASEFVTLQDVVANLQILKPPTLTKFQNQADKLYTRAIVAHDTITVQIINNYLHKKQRYQKTLNKFYKMANWAQDDLDRWYKIYKYCKNHPRLNRIYKQECQKAHIWFKEKLKIAGSNIMRWKNLQKNCHKNSLLMREYAIYQYNQQKNGKYDKTKASLMAASAQQQSFEEKRVSDSIACKNEENRQDAVQSQDENTSPTVSNIYKFTP